MTENHSKKFQGVLQITENHQESPGIAPKKFQSGMQITDNHQEMPRITKNCPKEISEWFVNH